MRINSSASKSKLQTGHGKGCQLSKSQTASAMAATPPPTQSIDGSNSVTVKSPSENLAESTTLSGTGTSPCVFSPPLEHSYLFSRSGVQVSPENGRTASATGQLEGPSSYHGGRLHSSDWDLEHPAVAPDFLQGNREFERPLFYPVALPWPHVDSQLPLGIVTNNPVYMASQALPPFRHGTSSPNTGTGIDSAKSRNSHTSPSLASTPSSGPLQTPTRYVHVNLVSERSDPYIKFEYPQLDLGPTPEALGTGTHVDLSRAQAAVPDFVAPTGSQLGPFESSAPLPSMYWLLFDTELDSVVDRGRDEVVFRSSSSGKDRAMEPPVTPTPVSFLAKWEDMLALERRICSSSHSAKRVQSKRAVHAVESYRTGQPGTGEDDLFRYLVLFFFLERADVRSKQIVFIVVQVAIGERTDEQRFSQINSLSGILKEPRS